MTEFDDVRPSHATEQIYRRLERKVRLFDAELGDRRVTGTFREDDAEGFAGRW